MNQAVEDMLSKYSLNNQREVINALKEIFQEIALLGLWRAKFFEHAAFYGGTALRILYGLDRFSEDMDFSLLSENLEFSLEPYNSAIIAELESFGFEVLVETKQKTKYTAIESAFIKANTIQQMVTLNIPATIRNKIHNMNTIKIKMEVDTRPPGFFNTEMRPLLMPIPFNVRCYVKEDLFAGKIHALLCRSWKTRVKGRDWYDFVWYIARDISVNLRHLKARLVQSEHLNSDYKFDSNDLLERLREKISNTDFELAKQDVRDFLTKPGTIDIWSEEFFINLLNKIKFVKT